MKTTLSFTLAATMALFSASTVSAVRTAQGCFGSSTGLTYNATLDFNSEGSCGDNCFAMAVGVFAMTNSTCWCGDELPPANMLADDDDCNLACPGYPTDICGGKGYWSVYLTGVTLSAANADPGPNDVVSSSSKSASATATATSASKTTATTTNAAGATVFITATAAVSTPTSSTTAAASSSSSGASKAGIAIGVVAGLVAVAGIIGAIWFFVRRRNRREVEEEYRRNAAVSNFIAGGKEPSATGASGANSFADTRLEQDIMANRRMSDGSIMDNQDYSRRILKVTNA